MQSQLVFQEEKERERLRRQNLLLSQAEKPALEHFFKGKSELSVLEIGCNDGARTFHRFSDDRISRVIGLEYNQQLVERANSQYGNTKFSFYQMDVDRDSFSADFQKLCTEPEDRERSKMEAQSFWMENIICRYCIRIPAKIMYHRYIWMDIGCRDDEKRNRETGSFFALSGYS